MFLTKLNMFSRDYIPYLAKYFSVSTYALTSISYTFFARRIMNGLCVDIISWFFSASILSWALRSDIEFKERMDKPSKYYKEWVEKFKIWRNWNQDFRLRQMSSQSANSNATEKELVREDTPEPTNVWKMNEAQESFNKLNRPLPSTIFHILHSATK